MTKRFAAVCLAALIWTAEYLPVSAVDFSTADTELYTVLSDCMPGEYSTDFGGWVFTNANGEGYIAETVWGLGGKAGQDGSAMILGYAGTEVDSCLDLYLQAEKTKPVAKAAEPVTLAYAMYTSAGLNCRFALKADTGNGSYEVYSAAPNPENGEMAFPFFQKQGRADMGQWNQVALFLDPQTGACRFSVNGKVWYDGYVNGKPEDMGYISKFRFVMKSENDDDFYALDDVCLLYGTPSPACRIAFAAEGDSVTATAQSAGAENVDLRHAALYVIGYVDGCVKTLAEAQGAGRGADSLSCTLEGVTEDMEVTAYLWDKDSLAPLCPAYQFYRWE